MNNSLFNQKLKIINGNTFLEDGHFAMADVYVQNGTILKITVHEEKGDGTVCDEYSEVSDAYSVVRDECSDINVDDNEFTVIDAEGMYVIPGLVDIHTHGAVGCDFSNGNKEELVRIAEYERSVGVTSFLPTSMSLPESQLKKAFINALEVRNGFDNFEYTNASMNHKPAYIAGINMEGPFINPDKAGAQNREYICEPDVKMFMRLMESCGNLIKLVTIAPEINGGDEFISELCGTVNISLGHSDADYVVAGKAFTNGANHVTHLYNAMRGLAHREPGLIGAACERIALDGTALVGTSLEGTALEGTALEGATLEGTALVETAIGGITCENKGVFAEIICDLVHVHPAAIKAAFKLFGEKHLVFISDSMEATGMPDGEYSLGGQKVYKNGNLATLEDDTLAGSVSNLYECMINAIKIGIPMESAIRCATINPAVSIGMEAEIGCIKKGARADILILDENLQIRQII